jgi:hypothetical protein
VSIRLVVVVLLIEHETAPTTKLSAASKTISERDDCVASSGRAVVAPLLEVAGASLGTGVQPRSIRSVASSRGRKLALVGFLAEMNGALTGVIDVVTVQILAEVVGDLVFGGDSSLVGRETVDDAGSLFRRDVLTKQQEPYARFLACGPPGLSLGLWHWAPAN